MKRFEIQFWSYMSAGSCGILSFTEIDARDLKSALNKFKKKHFPSNPEKRKTMRNFQRLLKEEKTIWSKIISVNEIERTYLVDKDVKKSLKEAGLSVKSFGERT